MTEPSENKTTITNTVDPAKSVKDELSEQELNKVAGGTDRAPKETVTFEYGALQVQYVQQKADGKLD